MFDSGASHCFVTPEFIDKCNVDTSKVVKEASGVVKVAGGKTLSILGHVKDVEVQISGEVMPADLIICSVELYDVILGMDWLGKCKANIDCHKGRVTFEREKGKLVYQGIRSTCGSLVISALQAEKMIEKGCEAYLVTIMTPETVGEVSVENIKVANEFEDVFRPLEGLPPNRSEPFTIELEPGTTLFRKLHIKWRQQRWLN